MHKIIYQFVNTVLFLSLTLCLWPVLIISCSAFLIYRKLVDFVLKRKFGKKYGGLLDFVDNVMIGSSSNRSIITCSLVVKCDVETDIFNIFEKKLENKVFNYPHDYPKLTSTQHVFGGYPYLIKNNYKLYDCLKLMAISGKTEFNEEYLKYVVGRMNMEPFPKNNTGLWHISVSEKYLVNYKNDMFYYYPVIIRFNHAVGDGASLITLLIHVLGDCDVENYSEKIFKNILKKPLKKYASLKPFLENTKNRLKRWMEVLNLFLYMSLIGLGKVIWINQLTADAVNALHGPEPCGDKIIAWHVEDNIEYIPIVKRTKNRLPDTKFSHIILTAASASIYNFFKRSKKPIPEVVTAVLPVILHTPTLENSKKVRLENKTVIQLFKLPFNQSNSLVKALEGLKENAKEVKYEDTLVSHFLLSKVAGMFPMRIAQKMLGRGEYTSIISNIPGGAVVTIQKGCVIDKLVPLIPNLKKVGISISILSYDDRFQVGVLVDKALKLSQHEVQQIADDIFYFIELLDIETKQNSNVIKNS